MNGACPLLVYADDDGNVNTIRRSIKAFLYASNEVGFELNAEKT
jgi:hypothetical protein